MINLSNIDYTIKLLDDRELGYSLEVIGEGTSGGVNYQIRRLVHGDNVILERLVYGTVGDSDIIESHSFLLDQEPENWAVEIEEC